MELGKLLYVKNAREWRTWLEKHHDKEREIWLVFFRKSSGKSRISYNDAVDEALCFGWIDSTVKNVDSERFAQRFTPRRPKSPVSVMNRERIRRLSAAGKMTPAGLAAVGNVSDKFKIAPDILKAIKRNEQTWKNFQSFDESYRRIRVAFIEGARRRPEEFGRRLRHFVKMTAKNKKFGMVK